MKLPFSILSTFLLTTVMVASLVIPLNLASPYPSSADPGIMKWDTVATPGSYDGSVMGKNGQLDIVNSHYPDGSGTPYGSEVISMSVSNKGNTVTSVIRYGDVSGASLFGYSRSTATSSNQGIRWRVGSDDPDYDENGAFKVYESEATASQRLVTTGGLFGPKIITGNRF
ncbi:MAG: hypothetical protein NTV42_01070, partial [Chloroflexi bacterium]|nr:hypothetical protein [Chloroflexota bacterium]